MGYLNTKCIKGASWTQDFAFRDSLLKRIKKFRPFFFFLIVLISDTHLLVKKIWNHKWALLRNVTKIYFDRHLQTEYYKKKYFSNVNLFMQGRIRIFFFFFFFFFFEGAKLFFLIFFSVVKCFFFPVESFHFVRPKTNFSGFEKWKKRKKKVLSSFCNFSTSYFHFFTFPLLFYNLPSFLLKFSLFFSCLFFPVGQRQFPHQKSLGGTLPLPPPPPRYATVFMFSYFKPNFIEKIFLETAFSNFGHLTFLAKWKLVYWLSFWHSKCLWLFLPI